MHVTKLTIGALSAAAAGVLLVGGAAVARADSSPSPTTSSGSASAQADGGTTGSKGACAGGQAGHQHTEVTGDEAASVTAAVTAKDSGISVTTIRKDPDGSYDVLGTKDGAQVMVEVSADLSTVEVRTGGPGGPGGRPGGGPGGGQPGAMSGSGTTSAQPSAAS